MARTREIARPWTQQPQEAVQLAPEYPWLTFVAPAVGGMRSMVGNASAWTKAATNNVTQSLSSSPLGQGLELKSGYGARVSVEANSTRTALVAVACLYLAPASAAGTVMFGFSTGSGSGLGELNVLSTGELTVSAANEDYKPRAALTLPGGDRRGLVTCVALQAGTWGGVVRIRAAVDGQYLGEDASTTSLGVRGNALEINQGSGFTGMTGALLYAGYYRNAVVQSPEMLMRLSQFGSVYMPQRIRIPVYSAAGGLPILSAATYMPGSLTSSGFRPRVTAS